MTILEIKNYMKKNKITQKQLSDMSGIPLQTLRKIFSGLTTYPRLDTMNAIESALGLNTPTIPNDEDNALLMAISTLSDEECEEVSKFIDYLISKRKQ